MDTRSVLISELMVKLRDLGEEDLKWLQEKSRGDLPSITRKQLEEEEERENPPMLPGSNLELNPNYLALVEKILMSPEKVSAGFRLFRMLGKLSKIPGALQKLGEFLQIKGYLKSNNPLVECLVEEWGFYRKELLKEVTMGDYSLKTLEELISRAPKKDLVLPLEELWEEIRNNKETAPEVFQKVQLLEGRL